MSIRAMKRAGINIFHAQMYHLILWELNGGDINEWINKYSSINPLSPFRKYWESLPEPKDNWWTRFVKKYICDWEENHA